MSEGIGGKSLWAPPEPVDASDRSGRVPGMERSERVFESHYVLSSKSSPECFFTKTSSEQAVASGAMVERRNGIGSVEPGQAHDRSQWRPMLLLTRLIRKLTEVLFWTAFGTDSRTAGRKSVGFYYQRSK
jgi:hypothetical protein